ncbi:alanine racemase [Terriglobus albidus]|uniref:alanine racemase n=1 Tax=Terriglobus albidus TaxID=1592106 RepID=UPI0021DF48BA|nr:alanine racemase [Terriglobus albidus]
MRAVEPNHVRPVWAEISASRLATNYRHTRGAAGMELLAVIKADGYGHGAELCAPVLAGAGAAWLGVTSVEEGVRVKASLGMLPSFLQPRILIMCGVWNGEAAVAVEHRLTPVIWEEYQLRLLEDAARARGLAPKSFPVHVEVDTGMARQGVTNLAAFAALIAEDSPLRIESAMTHLGSTEEAGSPLNREQMDRFAAQVKASSLRLEWIHAGNTSGVDAGQILAQIKEIAAACGAQPMARSGLALYGYALELTGAAPHVRQILQPVMAWKTRILSLRDVPAGATVGYNATFTAPAPMRLALIPVGYADGLRRELSNCGRVLLREAHAPIVGRVSMDLTVIDVTHIPDAAIGDEVTLIGDGVPVEEQAAIAGTIPYEILCGISERVMRILV